MRIIAFLLLIFIANLSAQSIPCKQTEVACEQIFFNWESNAVGIIQAPKQLGGKLMSSGFLVSNLKTVNEIKKQLCYPNPVDVTHYFLTCSHTFDFNVNGKLDAREIALVPQYRLFFNYRSIWCGHEIPFNPSVLVEGKGIRLVAYSEPRSSRHCDPDELDWALLEIKTLKNNMPSNKYKAYYTGVDPVTPISQEPGGLVMIHHPDQRSQKINRSKKIISPGWPCADDLYLNWATGNTQGGSSGAPIFNVKTRSCIGIIYGGGQYQIIPPWARYSCFNDASIVPFQNSFFSGLDTLLTLPDRPILGFLHNIASYTATIEGDKIYSNETLRLASTEAILFPPNVHMDSTVFDLIAPFIGYNREVGNTDHLYMENGSQLKIHAGGTNLPILTVGGYDERMDINRSVVELVLECVSPPILEKWQIRNRASVKIEAKNDVKIGRESVHVSEPAVIYQPGAEITIESKTGDIKIFQPIDSPVPNWYMSDGFVQLHTLAEGKGIYFRPGADLPQLQLKLAAMWDISTNSMRMQNTVVEVMMNGGLMMRGDMGKIFQSRIHVQEYAQEISMAWWRAQLSDLVVKVPDGMIFIGSSVSTNGPTSITIPPSLPPNAVFHENINKTHHNTEYADGDAVIMAKNGNPGKVKLSGSKKVIQIATSSIQLGKGEIFVRGNAGLDIKAEKIRIPAGQQLGTARGSSGSIRISILQSQDLDALEKKVMTYTSKQSVSSSMATSRQKDCTSCTYDAAKEAAHSVRKKTASLPLSFSLLNYPNPFNPITTIRLVCPHQSRTRINIHDLTGRLIVTLFEGQLDPGMHEFQWHPKKLASGAYLCQTDMSTESGEKHQKTLKLLYLK